MKRFITRNWLRQLWKLKNPKICSQQGEDPGELTEVPAQKPAGSRTKKKKNGYFRVQRPEKTNVSSSQTGAFPPTQVFVLFGFLVD